MFKKLSLIFISVLTAALLLASIGSVGAAEEKPSAQWAREDFISEIQEWIFGETGEESQSTEPETQPTEEPTEPTEPAPTEAPTEWEPAYVETTPPDDYDANWEEYNNLVESADENTALNSVKMDKSISNKGYTTDNIAGIVSWICVGVGLVVVLVMLLSTKLAGKSSARGE